MRFLRIDTTMYPVERIENINREANINGNLGVEVKLWNVAETFQYTGEKYAGLAYEVLQGVEPATAPPEFLNTVILAKDKIIIDEIEWVDFGATINGTLGVEVRVASDAPGFTRQYTGSDAGQAYDALAALIETVATA